jgi:hypothetical protein
MSVLEAAQGGDRRMALVALRDKLAAEIDVAPSTVVAQLAGQLTKVLAELEALPVTGKVSTLDELEKRRKDRLAAAEPDVPARRKARERRPRSS